MGSYLFPHGNVDFAPLGKKIPVMGFSPPYHSIILAS